MWLTNLSHEGSEIVQWGVVLGASCAAGLIDLRTRRIPNLLTIPVLLGGYAVATTTAGLAGLADAALASVLLSAPYVLLFLFAGGGAGDVKLMAALGAWLGLVNGAITLFFVALAGAALASIVLVACARSQRMASLDRPSPRRDLKSVKIPYGVAVWAGVWIAAGVLLWV